MKTIEETISSIKSLLSTYRAEVQGLAKDQMIRQWQHVDIEKHTLLFTDLGINQHDLFQATSNYLKTVDVALQDLRKYENELSNLEADLQLSGLAPQQALQAAARLENECRNLQKFLATISQYRELLIGAAQNIQQTLSLGNLLALAREKAAQSNRQREMFEQGFQVFNLVAEKADFTQGNINIHEIADQAERIETKFRRLELPAMPELAKVIMQRQIEICCEAVNEIHSFLASAGNSLQAEVSKTEDIRNDILLLKAKPFGEILTSLPEASKKLCKNINEFGYKFHLLKEMEKITFLLLHLMTVYEGLRYSYFTHISQVTSAAGLRLHPQVIADEQSRNYFSGLRGLLRRLRFFFSMAAENAPLDAEAVTRKIFVALTTCPYYYCVGYEEEIRLHDFIDSLIKEFIKPAPYDDLFSLIKESITTYGRLIEADFTQFPIPQRHGQEEETMLEAPDDTNEENQFGWLMARIEARADHLRHLRPQE